MSEEQPNIIAEQSVEHSQPTQSIQQSVQQPQNNHLVSPLNPHQLQKGAKRFQQQRSQTPNTRFVPQGARFTQHVGSRVVLVSPQNRIVQSIGHPLIQTRGNFSRSQSVQSFHSHSQSQQNFFRPQIVQNPFSASQQNIGSLNNRGFQSISSQFIPARGQQAQVQSQQYQPQRLVLRSPPKVGVQSQNKQQKKVNGNTTVGDILDFGFSKPQKYQNQPQRQRQQQQQQQQVQRQTNQNRVRQQIIPQQQQRIVSPSPLRQPQVQFGQKPNQQQLQKQVSQPIQNSKVFMPVTAQVDGRSSFRNKPQVNNVRAPNSRSISQDSRGQNNIRQQPLKVHEATIKPQNLANSNAKAPVRQIGYSPSNSIVGSQNINNRPQFVNQPQRLLQSSRSQQQIPQRKQNQPLGQYQHQPNVFEKMESSLKNFLDSLV